MSSFRKNLDKKISKNAFESELKIVLHTEVQLWKHFWIEKAASFGHMD